MGLPASCIYDLKLLIQTLFPSSSAWCTSAKPPAATGCPLPESLSLEMMWDCGRISRLLQILWSLRKVLRKRSSVTGMWSSA